MSYFLRVSLEIQQHRRIDGRDVCRPPSQPSAPVDGTRAVGWKEKKDSEVEGIKETVDRKGIKCDCGLSINETFEKLSNCGEKEKTSGS